MKNIYIKILEIRYNIINYFYKRDEYWLSNESVKIWKLKHPERFKNLW